MPHIPNLSMIFPHLRHCSLFLRKFAIPKTDLTIKWPRVAKIRPSRNSLSKICHKSLNVPSRDSRKLKFENSVKLVFSFLNILGLSRTNRMNSQKTGKFGHQTELLFSHGIRWVFLLQQTVCFDVEFNVFEWKSKRVICIYISVNFPAIWITQKIHFDHQFLKKFSISFEIR